MNEIGKEELAAQKLSRINTIIKHRTDHGTFEDEESELFVWLIEEREELLAERAVVKAKLEMATDQIKIAVERLKKAQRIK